MARAFYPGMIIRVDGSDYLITEVRGPGADEPFTVGVVLELLAPLA